MTEDGMIVHDHAFFDHRQSHLDSSTSHNNTHLTIASEHGMHRENLFSSQYSHDRIVTGVVPWYQRLMRYFSNNTVVNAVLGDVATREQAARDQGHVLAMQYCQRDGDAVLAAAWNDFDKCMDLYSMDGKLNTDDNEDAFATPMNGESMMSRDFLESLIDGEACNNFTMFPTLSSMNTAFISKAAMMSLCRSSAILSMTDESAILIFECVARYYPDKQPDPLDVKWNQWSSKYTGNTTRAVRTHCFICMCDTHEQQHFPMYLVA